MSQIETDFIDPAGLTPAVFVKKDGVTFLFDCGRAVYPPKLMLSLKDLFISHAHVDHLIGFDELLVMQLYAPDNHITIFGPEGITHCLMHKINGYTWNLVSPEAIRIDVMELKEDRMTRTCFSVNGNMEGEQMETQPINDGIIVTGDDFVVKRIYLNHDIPSVGYAFQENIKLNVRTDIMKARGFKGGSWIRQLKQAWQTGEHTPIEVQGKAYNTEELTDLIEENMGFKLVYVTDFLWDEPTRQTLPKFAEGADILYCEAAYKDEDLALARKNFHMTDSHAEELGRLSNTKKLIKFHRSERYQNQTESNNE